VRHAGGAGGGEDEEQQVGWTLSVYPEAREASGRFVATVDTWERHRGEPGDAADPLRSGMAAGSRARGKIRRYCVANRTNRFWTLTYQGSGCHDPVQLRSDLGELFRGVRDELGGKKFPYLWVPEWHKTDHGLHAHFVCNQYIHRSVIERVWQAVPGHGFVKGKLIGDLGVGSGTVDEARKAAGYIGKYMTKDLDEKRILGLHRYDVAQGFQPRKVTVTGPKLEEAVRRASELMGGFPTYRSTSDEWPDWTGPSAVFLSWDS